jgi:6-phosphofructo-2-kinase
VNPTSELRQNWKNLLEQHGIQTIFVESLCDDKEIIEQNVRSVKISSPDVHCPFLLGIDGSTLDGILKML